MEIKFLFLSRMGMSASSFISSQYSHKQVQIHDKERAWFVGGGVAALEHGKEQSVTQWHL